MSMTLPSSTRIWRRHDAYDRFYTPERLADQVVGSVKSDLVESVVDFTAGTGSLLAAAARRWPMAALYANDVDAGAMPVLLSLDDKMVVEASDFLSPCAGGRVTTSSASYDVILLNPPFTQRGGKPHRARGVHGNLPCSRAMAFVLTALSYLTPTGELIAILPTSTLHGDLDRRARELLMSSYNFAVSVAPDYGHFQGLNVSVFVLRLCQRGRESGRTQPSLDEATPRPCVQRGVISIRRRDRVETANAGWIHSTSIQDGMIVARYGLPEGNAGRLCPPGAIILPRVGRINVGHLVLLAESQQEVLSDCLLAVSFGSRAETEAAFERIRKKFDDLRQLYVGTGAPYVTNGKIASFLSGVA